MKKWNSDNIADQKGRVIVVTGATSGIGKETARVLAGKNGAVVMAVRNVEKGNKVIGEIRSQFPDTEVHVMWLDLSDLASVKDFAETFMMKFDRLDVLINNAGIMFCPQSKTRDGFDMQMGTNHFGHFALTGRLMPLLQQTENSRVIILSSTGIIFSKIDLNDLNWERRKYNTYTAYGDSKIANLYFAYELARRLEKGTNNPRVTAAHPGWTATELQRYTPTTRFLNHFFAQGVDMGALPTLRAGFDDEAVAGDFFGPKNMFHMRGYPAVHRSTKLSYNRENARRLFEISEQVTGVRF